MSMQRTILVIAQVLLVATAVAQTSSQKAAVQLSATVQTSPASITLSWSALPSTTSVTIYRKLKSANAWGGVFATPSTGATSYMDNTIAVGTAYEYKVVRVAAGVTGNGYICSGIQVPPVDFRGKLILLVDNTFSSSLSAELATLVSDMRGDGWAVIRTDLSRSASVSSVRSTILSQYNADPTNVKAVFIVGHLAVPYSGNVNPDGHSEHLGAWPCDGYYAELNGNWTDASVNNTGASRPENRNIPGDGKFDQSSFPSDLELQIGRVDMYDMPAFSITETELMRAYLNKAHGFKMKYWTPTARGLVFDNLQWVSNPLAATAWRAMAPVVGASNVTAANQGGTIFHDLVDNQSYLWTYSSGGGLQAMVGSTLTYNGADRVGTTQDYATNSVMGGVFNISFGSYFGDWDNKNNFLRAPLASGNALTSCWAAIPAWYFHHMAMGDNIGYSTLVSMNNTSLYSPLTDGWQSTMGKTHLALMGDPTLRMKMLVPPSNLTVTNAGGVASFSWNPSTETVDGYHLYRINGTTGVITRLTTSLVTGTTFSNPSVQYATSTEYMVRGVKLQVDPSGSYYNLSLGASTVTPAGAVADCLGVVGGTALPGTACNDGNACTANDVRNSSCQCVGTPITPVSSITASGSTSLCTGGSVVLNASTGSGYTYSWSRNGTSISGATTSSYTATQAGSYTVITNNSGCSVTSSAVSVTMSTAPVATITAGGATTFCSGGSVVLNTNTGTNYTYVWRLNGNVISGATASTYTATQAGSYTVVITSGSCSTTSAASTVTVSGAPNAVITAAGNTSICGGNSVLLTANTGTGYGYVWKLNGTTISGATSASYIASIAGSYTVVVSLGTCTATSPATVVSVGTAPTASITAGGATTFCSGGSVVLSASIGSGNTYVWRLNGTPINGATANVYTASASGSYTVVVSNAGCSTTSAATSVTVTAGPSAQITAGGSTTFCTGGSVLLSTASGAGYTYIWRRNGTVIGGATSNSYTASQAGSYTVTTTAGTCTATSASLTVAVGTMPTATISQGATAAFCTGSSVTLSTNSATGYTYAWKLNGVTINGATSNVYSASQVGLYTVTVTNNGCAATSAPTAVSSMSPPTITCSASPSTATVSVSVTSGTGPYTYLWNTSPYQTTATANIVASGTYIVTVKGVNGCATTCTVSILLPTQSCAGVVTVAQGTWGSSASGSNPAAYLTANFAAAFPSPNFLTIGCGTRLMRFTTPAAIIAALPTYGTPSLLPVGTTVNPTGALNNSFIGQLVSAKLNVRFDEINPAFSPYTGLLRNMIVTTGPFTGWTVQQVIDASDLAAGGCSTTYTRYALSTALTTINNGYDQTGEFSSYLTCPTSGLALQPDEPASGLLGDAMEVVLYPNPADGPVTLVLTGGRIDESVFVDLYNLSGAVQAKLHTGMVAAGMQLPIPFDVSAYAPGAYFCLVRQGDRMRTVKLMVE